MINVIINYSKNKEKESDFYNDTLQFIEDNFEKFNNFLYYILLEIRYSPGGLKSQDLEEEIKISDTLGDWTFDVFFGILSISIIYIGTKKPPSCWKLAEKEKNDTSKFKFIFKNKKEVEADFLIEISEKDPYSSTKKDGNLTIEKFLDDYHKKTNQKVDEFKRSCIKSSINNVKQLMDAIKHGALNNFSGIHAGIEEELKKYSLIKSSKPKLSYAHQLIQFKADLHKIKRYIYYKCNCLDELPYLDENPLNETYVELQKDFQNQPLLEKIRDLYFPLTTMSIKVDLPRGVLFYGPPGTGKTTVSQLFPDLIGLTPINYAIASTEVIRSLVGETEKLLRELCERAHLVPHLACYLSVDEIDALVPKRNSDEGKNKGDMVATLLALIGGIKDVPNLIFVASTNFLKKIDEAISRRMSEKFFVGRLNKDDRMKMIEKLLNFSTNEEAKSEKEKKERFKVKEMIQKEVTNLKRSFEIKSQFNMEDKNFIDIERIGITEDIMIMEDLKYLNSLMVNFTPAAVKNFCQKIKILFLEKLRNLLKDNKSDKVGLFEKIKANELKKLAQRTSQDFNIFFGSQTIFELISSVSQNNEKDYTKMLDIQGKCQGLVIANMVENKFMIKTEIEKRKVFQESEMFEVNSYAELYNDLIQYAYVNEIDSAQLVDNLSLQNNGCFDDKQCVDSIIEMLTELKNYKKSMLIFNLDSLVGINVSQSDGMGKSLSYSLGTTKLMDTIKSLGDLNANVKFNEKDKIQEALFIVICVNNSYLLDCLVNSLGNDKFPQKKEREEKKEKEMNEPTECVRCNKKYTEKDNNSYDSCNYHWGYLYDQNLEKSEMSLYDLKTNENFIRGSLKKKESKKDKENSDDSDEEQEKDWVYICCFQKLDSQGCKNNKHSKDKKTFQNEKTKMFKDELKPRFDKLKKSKV